MKSMFIENGSGTQKVYESMLVSPKNLSIFNSELALRIIDELAKQPTCAMDLARKIGQHEQKIYYHLKKMKTAGIVKLDRSEARYGMTAKIYSIVSPVLTTKLSENSFIESVNKFNHLNPIIKEFYDPFIKDEKLNAKVIVGYPYPHGKHDVASVGGSYIFNLALLFGNMISEISYDGCSYDVDINNEDMKSNLILFGLQHSNVIIDKVLEELPIHFTEDSKLFSKLSGKTYSDPAIGIIAKVTNPFKRNKKILIICGLRTRGLHAAVIAATQNIEEIVKNHDKNEDIIKIVEGLDRDNDKIIDSMKILE